MTHDYDVLIAGSGAAGLTCAIRAASLGLKVLVVEKEPVYGGTTARSGGWLWIPCNRHAREQGIADDLGAARAYLQGELDEAFDGPRTDAFLAYASEMVDFLERDTSVRFILGPQFADYHSDRPGALAGGRSLRAEPFDLRELGPLGRHLSAPFHENTFHGMMIDFGAELGHFYNATRSARSAFHVLKRLAAYGRDRVMRGRGQRLTTGNALAARLLKSAADADVELRLGTRVDKLLQGGGRVEGAVLHGTSGPVEIRPRLATVLACGGFSHDDRRRAALYPHVQAGAGHWTLAASGSTGDGLALGESAGGTVRTGFPHAAAWAPVSLIPFAGREAGRFPHFFDRAKPGMLAVSPDGKRFVNESASYHDFVSGMFEACRGGADVHAYIVCDQQALRRYGLGFVKPFPLPIGPSLRSGYLLRGNDARELAGKLGVPRDVLQATIARHNEAARRGEDPEFGKGGTAYNRYLGDATHRPNPCVRPLEGPLYAVKVVPGDIGTFAGLATDAQARVLDAGGHHVPGLYAIGNDMASMMGGRYPGAGITLGPGMTFAYIAANHIAIEAPHA